MQPNNLKALMALAVSYTNTGHQQDACEALKNWIRQNPKYKYLVKNKKSSPGLTRRMSKSPVDRLFSFYVESYYYDKIPGVSNLYRGKVPLSWHF